MASSTKVMFNLESLRQKAIESIDQRIEDAELEVKSFEDDAALDARVDQWRDKQLARLTKLVDQFDRVRDKELATFKIDKMPEVDRWERRDAERKLSDLKAKRTQIQAKTASLVPDDDGNIALTKTQLNEFFAL